ncbi:MAG TPA: response regulator [Steroidobacteraceae bacterium]|nr:response regulator [Steroidobacteraceae bacterium]
MEVLLVEDNSEVSLITVEYLTELGHSAVAVPAAESALQRLAERSFDAVMTDVGLPGMSGIDLAKELSRHYPKLPVVISSGYGSLNVEFGLGTRQPNVFLLPKPYDLPMLEKTLTEAAAFAST